MIIIDKTANHRSEFSKLAQKKYKIKYDCMRKVFYWELCKKPKFDHTTKWYMHKLESVREIETTKILWDFEIQTDHLISARRPELMLILKKIVVLWIFTVLADEYENKR